MILAGDVGGTKTHLALYEPGADPHRPQLERKVASREYASLEKLLGDFLATAGASAHRAVLGIAGPVVDNRAETTNLPWTVSADSLSQGMGGGPVTLLNDLAATAWGLETLDSADLRVIQAGEPRPGNRALIAAGTGLGEAVLVWDGGHWHPSASEGGHSDFAARDEIEDMLSRWLRQRYGHVSYERVLSGPGIADLYRFFAETDRGQASLEVAARFATSENPAAVVTQAALEGRCERCRLALERFVSLHGAEAGNLALKSLAVGGLYVGGGIAPRILPALEDGTFMESFRAKGRLRPLMERIPVSVILRPETALWGAAACALSQVPDHRP